MEQFCGDDNEAPSSGVADSNMRTTGGPLTSAQNDVNKCDNSVYKHRNNNPVAPKSCANVVEMENRSHRPSIQMQVAL